MTVADVNKGTFNDKDCVKYRNYWPGDLQYSCPCCETNFRFLSALLQHVATEVCNQDYSLTIKDTMGCISRGISNMSERNSANDISDSD